MADTEYAHAPEWLGWMKAFVAGAEWTTAKDGSHQYAVRRRCLELGLDDEAWSTAVLLIRNRGKRERSPVSPHRYWYLALNGHRYWTMTGVPRLSQVINRARLEPGAPPDEPLFDRDAA